MVKGVWRKANQGMELEGYAVVQRSESTPLRRVMTIVSKFFEQKVSYSHVGNEESLMSTIEMIHYIHLPPSKDRHISIGST